MKKIFKKRNLGPSHFIKLLFNHFSFLVLLLLQISRPKTYSFVNIRFIFLIQSFTTKTVLFKSERKQTFVFQIRIKINLLSVGFQIFILQLFQLILEHKYLVFQFLNPLFGLLCPLDTLLFEFSLHLSSVQFILFLVSLIHFQLNFCIL